MYEELINKNPDEFFFISAADIESLIKGFERIEKVYSLEELTDIMLSIRRAIVNKNFYCRPAPIIMHTLGYMCTLNTLSEQSEIRILIRRRGHQEVLDLIVEGFLPSFL